MIEGMEILKKTELVKVVFEQGWWIVPLIITCLSVFLGILFVSLYIKRNDYGIEDISKIGNAVSLAIIICSIPIAFSWATSHVLNEREVHTGKYIYEVSFSTEEAFTEAYREYDFLKKNTTYGDVYGTIYTLRDKGIDFDYVLAK